MDGLIKYQSIMGVSFMDRMVNLIKYSDDEVSKMRLEQAQRESKEEVMRIVSQVKEKTSTSGHFDVKV